MSRWIRRCAQGLVVLALAVVALLSVGIVRAWPVIGPNGWNPASLFTSDTLVRFYELPELAKIAEREGRHAEARELAAEALQLAPQFSTNWNYGNAIHDGHVVLGLVALAEDDVEATKGHLLSAGATPGSPQLDTFGPNTMLAEALLEAGEVETVLAYFERTRAFWEMHDGRLDRWSDAAAAGEKPAFGCNLDY